MLKKSLALPIKLLFRLVLSPIVIFVVGYIYYGGDTQKAYYLALLGYTAIVVVSLVFTAMTIVPTMATFRVVKFVKKSYKAVSMTVALGIYWAIYLIFWS